MADQTPAKGEDERARTLFPQPSPLILSYAADLASLDAHHKAVSVAGDVDQEREEEEEAFREDFVLGMSIAERKKMERIQDILDKRAHDEPQQPIQSFDFLVRDEVVTDEVALAGKWLYRACERRHKYLLPKTPLGDCTPSMTLPLPSLDNPQPPASTHICRMEKGVYFVYENQKACEAHDPLVQVHDVDCFTKDLRSLLQTCASGPIKSVAYRRLSFLEAKFKLHRLLNSTRESEEQKSVPHRDFYNVRKVDTHVHHSSCMHQKHLLRFMRKKLRTDGSRPVIERDGKVLTLQEVFDSLKLTSYDLSIDTLDVHADATLFHRFDRFNLKYNPFGQSRLREVFLKTDNLSDGLYLAEITKEVFDDLERDKYQFTELRISIYGRSRLEWSKLARWVVTHNLFHHNNRWLIQIPRIAHLIIAQGIVTDFEHMLDNIFGPLFDVSIDPASDPYLHVFLQHVIGFDSVDDESVSERKLLYQTFVPSEWNGSEPVPYWAYMYYMWANINTLNDLRLKRGMSCFQFRPHCGEAGDVDHVACCFLLADGINHGITIRKWPVMEYLYMLERVGIAMSPMSNNSLFLAIDQNPFARYFQRGLNVSLSTDDPLQFHSTHEPLMEEYGLAKQVFHLSTTDLCEIARNSVLQSGYEHPIKAYFLGSDYWAEGELGNNIDRTNVSNLRIALRHDLLTTERKFVSRCAEHSLTVERQVAGKLDLDIRMNLMGKLWPPPKLFSPPEEGGVTRQLSCMMGES